MAKRNTARKTVQVRELRSCMDNDFRTPLIYLATYRNPQGLHDALQAVGLQIDPAYNQKGYVVVESW